MPPNDIQYCGETRRDRMREKWDRIDGHDTLFKSCSADIMRIRRVGRPAGFDGPLPFPHALGRSCSGSSIRAIDHFVTVMGGSAPKCGPILGRYSYEQEFEMSTPWKD